MPAEAVGLLALRRVCLYALLMKSEHLVPSVGRTQPLSGPSLLVPSLLEALFQQCGQAQKAPPLLLPCSEDCSLGSGPSCCAPRSLVVVSSLGHCSKVATVSCC